MARFRFRFEKLLEIKNYRRRMAEETLAASLRECQVAERRAEESGRLAEVALTRMKRPGVYSVWQIDEGQRYAAMLRERWQHDLKRVHLLRGKVDEARRLLIEATKEHQALEKLREKHLEAHLQQAAADEQKLLDDLSTISHIRLSREASQQGGR